ncbi:hypothetical protein KKA49_03820, partial [Patescibacteria group bacterium]|nr:hypothetical protein [Patescibacteria group bacterium]MBU1457644.1 hypothetical protein [Patescibacteria group bacterium]
MKERDLDPIEVDRLLQSNWGIKAEQTNFVTMGDSTLNWIIKVADKNDCVLRNAGSFRHYVRFQCDVLSYLAESEFPYQAPKPLRTRHGEFVVDIKSGSYFVYPFISGNTPSEIDRIKSVDVGKMLASYHQHIEGFEWEGRLQLRSKNLLESDVFIDFIQRCKDMVGGKETKSKVDLVYLGRFEGLKSFYEKVMASVDV